MTQPGRFARWWQVFLVDLRQGLVGALVSAVVASIITFIGISIAQQDDTLTFVMDVDRDGRGQPALLFSEAINEIGDQKIELEFDPPELMQVAVCEYAILRGTSAGQAALSYLDRYPMCFNVMRGGTNKYVVRPNRRSGWLVEETPVDGKPVFTCKCN